MGETISPMARDEQDREDVLREATALVERAELTVEGFDDPIVVGFRTGGAASVFIGADPVYQFNTLNELRRAYRDGRLVKAMDGKLFELERYRTQGQVQLLRRELDETARAKLLGDSRSQLAELRDSLASGQFQVVGQVPTSEDVVARIQRWLAELPESISVANHPNVV